MAASIPTARGMKYVVRGAGVFFLLFVGLRAARVPFTYDEAASYMRYIDTSVPSVFDTNLLSVFNFEVATNHVLNTALTKLSYTVAGASELALRLPNVFGYVLYLGFAALTLRRLSDPRFALGAFLLLNLNPYLLDFFALSRGYGLSLGLLMGSLFFFLRCLEPSITGRIDRRDLLYSLALACAAVMANFALLNVYISMLCVLVFAAAFFHGHAARRPGPHRDLDVAHPTHAFLWPALAALIFIPIVLSQDIALSQSLYEPVLVRLIGLDDNALGRARVVRIDIHGRESLLGRTAGSAGWSSNGRSHFRGVRIELPREEAERLTRVEAIVGARAFSFDPRLTDAWVVRDAGDTRFLESTPGLSLRRSRVSTFHSVINWAGDRIYAIQLMMASGSALGIFAMCALLLRLVGRIVVRTRMIGRGEWRALVSSVLWVAALAGTPLYLLKRNSELYFGGTRGLVDDTFASVIANSFYGKIYSSAQTVIVFTGLLGIVAIFFVVLAFAHRRHRLSTIAPAGSLLAILVITSSSLAAQRVLFGTVYLVGRTALFYIPLFVLFFAFVCDHLAQTGRAGRIVAMSIVVAAVSLAAVHFSRTANIKYVYDWKDDASTKSMMEDLRQFAAGRPLTLGVAPGFVPVAVYYARRSSTPIEVVAVPVNRAVDFLYLEDRDVHAGNIISRYSLTHTALAIP